MHNYPELSIKRTTVKDEFKFEKVRTKESSEYEKWIDAIDFSHCKNVWLNGIKITNKLLRKIEGDMDLDRLILDKCELSSKLNGEVNFKSKTLRMLEYIPAILDDRNDETIQTPILTK